MHSQLTNEGNKTSTLTQFEAPFKDPQMFSPDIKNQMMQVIYAQNKLIQSLIEHQNFLFQKLKQECPNSKDGPRANNKQNIYFSGNMELNHIDQFSSVSNQIDGPKQSENRIKIVRRVTNIIKPPPFKRIGFKYQINSSQQQIHLRQQQNIKKNKLTQTKNMIKNFVKAIFRFIRKNKGKIKQVLHRLNINETQFMKVYQKYKGEIHSITELRSLWSDSQNQYSKAFRIISFDYLRKHSFQTIFNSRVVKYSTHLKYRSRLLEVLENPQEFTALKTN